jgi:hypothetical protein
MIKPRPGSGFALVISLVLMAFILLLLLSISTLVRVELHSASTAVRTLEARQNALLGLNVALGELQAAAGPDQRVSARADILSESHASKSRLVGVWSSAPDDSSAGGPAYNRGDLVRWLVSDATGAGYNTVEARDPGNGGDFVPLLWTGSLADQNADGLPDDSDEAVVVDLRETTITGRNGVSQSGRYAWWVEDEGVKARINLTRSADDTVLDLNALKNRAVLEAGSFRTSDVSGLSGLEALDLQDKAEALASYTQLGFLPGAGTEALRKDYFGDLTLWSLGLQTDVKNGGLKRDLSLAFEMDDAKFNASEFAAGGNESYLVPLLDSEISVQPVFVLPNATGIDAHGPVWHLLRDYYRIYHRMEKPMTDPTFDAQVFGPNLNHDRYDLGSGNIGGGNILKQQPALKYGGGLLQEQGNTPYIETHRFDADRSNNRAAAFYRIKEGAQVAMDEAGDPYRAHGSAGFTPIVSASYMPYLMRMVDEFGLQFTDRVLVPTGEVDPSTGDPITNQLYRMAWKTRNTHVIHNPYNVKLRHRDLNVRFAGIRYWISAFDEDGGDTANLYDSNGNQILLPPEEYLFNEKPTRNFTDHRATIQAGTMAPGEIQAYEGLLINDASTYSNPVAASSNWHDSGAGGNKLEGAIRVPDPQPNDPDKTKWESYPLYIDAGPEGRTRFTFISRFQGPATTHSLANWNDKFNGHEYSYGLFKLHYFMDNGGLFNKNNPRWPMASDLETYFLGPGRDYGKRAPTAPRTKGAIYFPMEDSDFIEGPDNFKAEKGFPTAYSIGGDALQPVNHTSAQNPFPLIAYDLLLKPSELVASSGENLRYPVFALTNPLAPVRDNKNILPLDDWEKESDDPDSDGSGFHVLSPGWSLSVRQPSAGVGVDYRSWGASSGQGGGGVDRPVLLELPTAPVLSLGKLQFANITVHDHMPALAIGNSLASPYVPRDADHKIYKNRYFKERVFFDISYLMNEALWDSCFFSSLSIPYDAVSDDYDESGRKVRETFDAAFPVAAGADPEPLPNPRVALLLNRGGEDLETVRDEKLFDSVGDPAADGYRRSAENLVVKGAFNVNSTSVDAWMAVLSGARGQPVYRSGQTGATNVDASDTPYARFAQPVGGEASGSEASSLEAWSGFRALPETQLRELAEHIVSEIKDRSGEAGFPFLSLGSFVNRRLSNDASGSGLRGVLQAAIDRTTGINQGMHNDLNKITAEGLDTGLVDFTAAENINLATGADASAAATGADASAAMTAPTYLLQADLLQAIGSFLTARSDTFRIRAYGESRHPVDGQVIGRAWCEAVVQRVPEPIQPAAGFSSGDPEYWSALDAGEPTPFGRRFEIVSLRWLDEDEI